LIAEVNRDPKKRRKPYHPNEFNPYLARRKRRGKSVSVDELADDIMNISHPRGRKPN
jgi:hypothetical protein